MRKGQKKKPNAQTIKVHEKERQALELRLAGVRLADIAVQLGYADHSGARLAIDRAMKRLGPLEEAEELRQMEMHRLDDLQFTAAPLLASSKPDETKCAGIDRTLKGHGTPRETVRPGRGREAPAPAARRGASGRLYPRAMGRSGIPQDPRKEEWWPSPNGRSGR